MSMFSLAISCFTLPIYLNSWTAKAKLESILKSRDIILPIKVHIVKAIVFLIVMYRCESWTIKKVER